MPPEMPAISLFDRLPIVTPKKKPRVHPPTPTQTTTRVPRGWFKWMETNVPASETYSTDDNDNRRLGKDEILNFQVVNV